MNLPKDDGPALDAAKSGRYVWACSVCRDPDYTSENEGWCYYLDLRYCPTCRKKQPIISYHVEDVPRAHA